MARKLKIPASTDKVFIAQTSGWRLDQLADGTLGGFVVTTTGLVLVVSLPNGFVDIEAGTYLGPVTRLRFVYRGREYVRSFTRMMTKLAATRAASQFAFQVSNDLSYRRARS